MRAASRSPTAMPQASKVVGSGPLALTDELNPKVRSHRSRNSVLMASSNPVTEIPVRRLSAISMASGYSSTNLSTMSRRCPPARL